MSFCATKRPSQGVGLPLLALLAWGCADGMTAGSPLDLTERVPGCGGFRRGCTADTDRNVVSPTHGPARTGTPVNVRGNPDAGGRPTHDVPSADTASGVQRQVPLKHTPPGLLVAFIGDQGASVSADAVLELIAHEGADAVLHGGDFDYRDDPAGWESRIESVFGKDYPYLSTVGNHDAFAWSGPTGYQAKIAERVARSPDLHCEGEVGVTAACEFRGLKILQSCVGVQELDPAGCAADARPQLDFLAHALARHDHLWTICTWHKNQRDFQIGSKNDEVGFGAYRLCMEHGAIIATAHEHSYARTTTLSDIGNSLTGHGAYALQDAVEVAPGKTFAFVSGLGGRSIRGYDASHDTDTWWGAYAANNAWMSNGVVKNGTADYGALFIRFNVDGEPDKARGYFKDITGRILDDFIIYARPNSNSVPLQE